MIESRQRPNRYVRTSAQWLGFQQYGGDQLRDPLDIFAANGLGYQKHNVRKLSARFVAISYSARFVGHRQ